MTVAVNVALLLAVGVGIVLGVCIGDLLDWRRDVKAGLADVEAGRLQSYEDVFGEKL